MFSVMIVLHWLDSESQWKEFCASVRVSQHGLTKVDSPTLIWVAPSHRLGSWTERRKQAECHGPLLSAAWSWIWCDQAPHAPSLAWWTVPTSHELTQTLSSSSCFVKYFSTTMRKQLKAHGAPNAFPYSSVWGDPQHSFGARSSVFPART